MSSDVSFGGRILEEIAGCVQTNFRQGTGLDPIPLGG